MGTETPRGKTGEASKRVKRGQRNGLPTRITKDDVQVFTGGREQAAVTGRQSGIISVLLFVRSVPCLERLGPGGGWRCR